MWQSASTINEFRPRFAEPNATHICTQKNMVDKTFFQQMNPSRNYILSSIEWIEISAEHICPRLHNIYDYYINAASFFSMDGPFTRSIRDWQIGVCVRPMFSCVFRKHLSFSSTTKVNRPFQVLRPWVAHKIRSSGRFCNLAARISHFNADKQLKERTKNGMKIDWPNKRTDRFKSACVCWNNKSSMRYGMLKR